MDRQTKIILEAAKRPAKTKSAKKVEDPNEVNRKLRGLAHRVGYTVHAGLHTKGGAGYRGEVVKIDKDHTYLRVSTGKYGDRIVKAPHHLVSVHEETVTEESKSQKKERLKREAEEATRSYRKYQKQENERESHDERRKHHHEHERKMHREEVVSEEPDMKKTWTSLGQYMRRRAEVERQRGNHEAAAKKDKTAEHWERLAANEETNTEARQKESLVGRPNDPPVKSKKSVLHKTLEIKTNILD